MGGLYRLNSKQFIKTLYLPLIYLALLGYTGYQVSIGMAADAALFTGIINTLYCRVGLVGFVFFLFASFEFLYQSRDRGLHERVSSIPNAYRKTVGAGLLVLLTLALIYFAVTAGFAQYFAFRGQPFDTAYFFNTLLSSVLYLLGPALIALLLGAVGAQYLNRLGFYVLGLVLVFLVSDFSEYFVMVAGFQSGDTFGIPVGLTLLKVCGLLRSLLPFFELTNDYAFGQGLEPFKWELLLFWLCLCAALLLWKLRGRKKLSFQLASGAMAAVCLFGLVGYWNPGSNWRTPAISKLDNIMASDYIYYSADGGGYGNQKYNETRPAQFSVAACDLSLSMWKQLSADATLILDGTTLDSYDFTLYHGYAVSGVTDKDGKLLEYERWQDYLRVKNPGNTALTELTVHYAGFHPEYYSTAQGAYLPGFLPYYPMEGLFPVYDDQSGLNYSHLPAASRTFTVRVRSACAVFTNLEKQPDGSFQGNARQLTLVGGMYQESKQNGTAAVTPYTVEAKDYKMLLQYYLRMVEDATGIAYPVQDLQKVFVAPSMMFPVGGAGVSVFLDDVLLVYDSGGGDSAMQSVAVQVVADTLPDTDAKRDVKTALLGMAASLAKEDETGAGEFANQFGYDIEGDYIYVDSFPEQYNREREIQYYIYKALLGSDVKTIYTALDTYLKDDSDTRTELEFAKTLSEQYPIKEEAQQP